VVGEGCPGVDIEGNGGGRGIVGAEIKVSVTPPAVAVKNRRGTPHAVGVENGREEGQGAVVIENEREEGVGAKEVPPAKHHVLSS